MKTVLIVEDNATFRATLKIALEDLGLLVLATGLADTAYHILGAEHVDFALIDVRLPISSGLALYESIHKRGPHLIGRTALMTGYPEDIPELHQMDERGRVFTKPFRTEDVADWIRDGSGLSARDLRLLNVMRARSAPTI